MDYPVRVLATFTGLFVGLFIWSRTIQWVYALWILGKERLAPSAGPPIPTVPSGGIVAGVFLHSGPWLLGIAAYVTYHIFSTPHRPEWVWFFQGVAGTPVLIAFSVSLWFLQSRKKKASPPA